jgi:alkanesulfonate monooxygenase SsuD/methylene tetrahydromethanopterin reductase-like flavin-dependent oxidoreductase (luciferase family)
MRIALFLEGQEGIDWPQFLSQAQAAEAAGIEALFRSDHYRSIVRGEPAGSLETWVSLGAIAACTERIRLGTLVSPVTFRHVSVLAKSVVTVDRISGGRVELGLGAGWFEAEHATYGFPFGSLAERLDELDRQLEELNRQWADDEIEPKPVQRPRPPVIVGGKAKPRTVRAAVRFADEYNSPADPLDVTRERARTIRRISREAGRELPFSVNGTCVIGRDRAELGERLERHNAIAGLSRAPHLHGTVDEVAEQLRGYESAGVSRAMLRVMDHDDLDVPEVMGELARQLA